MHLACGVVYDARTRTRARARACTHLGCEVVYDTLLQHEQVQVGAERRSFYVYHRLGERRGLRRI